MQTQKQVVDALLKPETYDEGTEQIELSKPTYLCVLDQKLCLQNEKKP
jgi:hypothetical protein